MAALRTYEVIFITNPDAGEEETTKLIESLQHTITDKGGTITKNESMGRRTLAYEIERKREGIYTLFEIDGTGREIAELERRMRVNDQVMRYITVRVDEDRRRAEKLNARRLRKAGRRPLTTSGSERGAAAAAGGVASTAASSSSSSTTPAAVAPPPPPPPPAAATGDEPES
ncbi:MAG: 30S ribosomal protein S6 [Pyrinomonadaceae bacterium]